MKLLRNKLNKLSAKFTATDEFSDVNHNRKLQDAALFIREQNRKLFVQGKRSVRTFKVKGSVQRELLILVTVFIIL